MSRCSATRREVLGMAGTTLAAVATAPARASDGGAGAAGAIGPLRGMALPSWWLDDYARSDLDRTMASLVEAGCNWVQLIVTYYQPDHRSIELTRHPQRTPSMASLAHATRLAHRAGLRVMLKLHVDLDSDPDHWRGDIGSAFADAAAWQHWFAAYRVFALRHAAFAAAHGVEQFCVGTELLGTSGQEERWRELIAAVREHYRGTLLYAANHSGEELAIRFWDALDLIGVDAYYPLSESLSPSFATVRDAWTGRGIVALLQGLSRRYADRPVLLTEIGYRSTADAAVEPWNYRSRAALDTRLQRDLYRAAFTALWNEPWLAGMYWWYWDLDPTASGPKHRGYTPFGKPAEDVLRRWYGR